jgi:hypothetical protein
VCFRFSCYRWKTKDLYVRYETNLFFLVCFSENRSPSFSPRMEYNEWLPVGRGDPLKNDPTFDYSPPVVGQVRYWTDNAAKKEQTNEILLLGVPSNNGPQNEPPNHGPIRRTFFTNQMGPNKMEIPTVLMPPPMHDPMHRESTWTQNPLEEIGCAGVYKNCPNKMNYNTIPFVKPPAGNKTSKIIFFVQL